MKLRVSGSHAPAWEQVQTLQRRGFTEGFGPLERSNGIPTLERGNENHRFHLAPTGQSMGTSKD